MGLGGTRGFCVGHVNPEAATGGPIGLLKDGDIITIDAENRELRLHLEDPVISRRLAAWRKPKPNTTRGVLAKYARLVGSASEGAVTDNNLD